MKNRHIRLKQLSLLALSLPLLSVVTAISARADEPGRHPFYAHAEADLHQAKWLISHRPGDNWEMGRNEQRALEEIGRAEQVVMQLGLDVGKDMYHPEHSDIHPDRRGRLHDAIDTLEKAHDDLAHEEDDPRVRGMQRDALHHIDDAIDAIRHAMHDAGY